MEKRYVSRDFTVKMFNFRLKSSKLFLFKCAKQTAFMYVVSIPFFLKKNTFRNLSQRNIEPQGKKNRIFVTFHTIAN